MIPVIKYDGKSDEIYKKIVDRSQLNYTDQLGSVRNIINDIKTNGDKALLEYTEKFDKVKLKNIEVTDAEIKSAYDNADKDMIEVIKRAASNIKCFHQKQKNKTWLDTDDGKILGQLINPIEKAGVYVPGGRAAYPSSVLMNVIPAKVAGVSTIVMTTPPDKCGKINDLIIVAAVESGVNKIYKAGGAQAIAAMAFGTETIPKVDKIVGPGNLYVALAKKEVYGYVGIDMIAGPSEILIVADKKANPAYMAADLMSQAEHDPLAVPVLITDSNDLAKNVCDEIDKQIKTMTREKIIKESMENHGAIMIVDDLDEGIKLANIIAPEHLELAVENPLQYIGKVRNAGAVFLGYYSPEPLGDYFAGPNHVLPTGGSARFFSPLNVDDFMKKTSIIYYSKDRLKNVSSDIQKFAYAEGLTAHANSIKVRFENK